MFLKIRTTSGKSVQSQVGLMYGSPDGSESIELDTLEELLEFVREQGHPVIIEKYYRDENQLMIEVDDDGIRN